MSKSLFIVTSAIHTRFGVYNAHQRLQQTIETFKSIRQRCDASIILIDAGDQIISDEDVSLLKLYASDVLQFSNDELVKAIQKDENCFFVKSFLEILLLKSTFTEILKHPDLKEYSRIFKISGRYVLNDYFDYQKHLEQSNKITIKSSMASIYSTEHWAIKESATEYYRQYMTRLWSFDTKLLPNIIEAYQNMQTNLINLVHNNKFQDIEHLMFCHLDKSLITEFNTIGVQGTIAPNGVLFID